VYDYVFKTENLGYWQVHIFPVIQYFPHDAGTGQPNLKAPPMGRKEAFAKKVQSINDPNSVTLRDYRNPFLSDSASSIISLAFTDDGTLRNPMNKRSAIWLSGSVIGSKMEYEHYPARMFRVENNSESSVNEAIVQSYADDNAHAEEMRTLDSRCPGWRTIDRINSTYIFPTKDRVNGVFKQDDTYNTGIFSYNNCPCTYIKKYRMTAAQLRKFIFKVVPTCSYESMQKALTFYNDMHQLLMAPEDQKLLDLRIKTVRQLIANRERIYSTDINRDWSLNEVSCPQSWVDLIP
jgi:hypothetical protein